MAQVVLKAKTCLVILALLLVPNLSYAQNAKSQGPMEVRDAVGAILLSGLVGGVLGLSTLSFYPKPQEHIQNITYGAGLGIIISAFYLTLDVASTPLSPSGGRSDLRLRPLWDGVGSLALRAELDF